MELDTNRLTPHDFIYCFLEVIVSSLGFVTMTLVKITSVSQSYNVFHKQSMMRKDIMWFHWYKLLRVNLRKSGT